MKMHCRFPKALLFLLALSACGDPRAVVLPLQYPDGTPVTTAKGEGVMAGFQTYGSATHSNATALYERARPPTCATCARLGAVLSEPSTLRQATNIVGATTTGAGAVMTGVGMMQYGIAAGEGKLGTNYYSDTEISGKDVNVGDQYDIYEKRDVRNRSYNDRPAFLNQGLSYDGPGTPLQYSRRGAYRENGMSFVSPNSQGQKTQRPRERWDDSRSREGISTKGKVAGGLAAYPVGTYGYPSYYSGYPSTYGAWGQSPGWQNRYGWPQYYSNGRNYSPGYYNWPYRGPYQYAQGQYSPYGYGRYREPWFNRAPTGYAEPGSPQWISNVRRSTPPAPEPWFNRAPTGYAEPGSPQWISNVRRSTPSEPEPWFNRAPTGYAEPGSPQWISNQRRMQASYPYYDQYYGGGGTPYYSNNYYGGGYY